MCRAEKLLAPVGKDLLRTVLRCSDLLSGGTAVDDPADPAAHEGGGAV